VDFKEHKQGHANTVTDIRRNAAPGETGIRFRANDKDQGGQLIYNPPVDNRLPSEARHPNSAAMGAGAVAPDANEWAVGSDAAFMSMSVFGNIRAKKQGSGFEICEGTNARMGVGTLSGSGTFIVYNTSVRSNSRIFLTHQNTSGTAGFVKVSTRTSQVSFTVASSSATDASDVAWVIFTPA
jgi:hypothetical protein